METTDKGTAALALVKHEPIAPSPYEPRDFREAQLMAKDFAGSKLTRCRTPEQALLIMATGRELGIPATTALRMIYVADFGQGDQVTLSADLMVALCLRSPLCEYFRCTESTDEKATYETKRRGDPPRTATFTIADKERAKLGKVKEGKDETASNWAKYPRVMLRHRAASELAREVYPDVIGGFYTPEEASEIRELPVVESRPVVDAKVVEQPAADAAPPSQPTVAELETRVRAAKSQEEGDAVAKEIVQVFPDRESAERKFFRQLLSERKAAGWAAEPPHDKDGVVQEREAGQEG